MKKYFKNILIIALVATTLFPAASAVDETEPDDNVIVLKNEKPVHNLKIHDTEIVQYMIDLEEGMVLGEDYKVAVHAAPEGIVEVVDEPNQLTVIAKKVGNAKVTIMVKITGENVSYTKELNFSVTQEKATLKFNQTSHELVRGTEFTVDFEVDPKTTDLSRIVWESSESAVATVVNGVVSGKKIGKTTIMATLDGTAKTMEVEVIAPLERLEFNASLLSVNLNATENIPDLIYVPYDTTVNRKANYKIEDETIAVIEDGAIRGLKTGETTLTATIGDITAELVVKVSEASIIGNAHTLLLAVVNQSDEGMNLEVRDFKGLEKDIFELFLPTDEILSYMENREYTRIYVKLDDELLKNNLNNMERMNLDKEILLQLGAQKLEIYFVNSKDEVQFVTYFDERIKQDFNLSFKLEKIPVEDPLYPKINNKHSFRLSFVEEELTGIRFGIVGSLLETHSEQIYFHYRAIDQFISEVETQVKTGEDGLLTLNIKDQINIISLTPISISNYNWIIIGLSLIVVAILASIVYKNRERLHFKK